MKRLLHSNLASSWVKSLWGYCYSEEEKDVQTTAQCGFYRKYISTVRPYREVLKEPCSHYICGHFREDASFLLPLLVLIVLVSRAWWCQAVVKAISCSQTWEESRYSKAFMWPYCVFPPWKCALKGQTEESPGGLHSSKTLLLTSDFLANG